MRVSFAPLNDNQRLALWEAGAEAPAYARCEAMLLAYVSSAANSGVDVTAWTLAGRDHFLLHAFQQQFGEQLDVEGQCAACDTKQQLMFSVFDVLASCSEALSAARVSSTEIESDAYKPGYQPVSLMNVSCQMRLPSVGDLRLVAQSGDPLVTFAECVIEPSSYSDVAASLETEGDWQGLFDDIEAQLLAIEPLSIVSLNARCPDCGAETVHQLILPVNIGQG